MFDIINNFLVQYPKELVLGVAGLIGGSIHAGITIYKKKKELGNKFKFELPKLLDTIWQSTIAGVLAAQAMGCNVTSVVFSILAAAGIDTLANKTLIFPSSVMIF